MNLVDLRIEKKYKAGYEGKATFSCELGRVSLKLNQSHIDKIFKVCATSIEQVAKHAASELTCHVIEHKKLIDAGG